MVSHITDDFPTRRELALSFLSNLYLCEPNLRKLSKNEHARARLHGEAVPDDAEEGVKTEGNEESTEQHEESVVKKEEGKEEMETDEKPDAKKEEEEEKGEEEKQNESMYEKYALQLLPAVEMKLLPKFIIRMPCLTEQVLLTVGAYCRNQHKTSAGSPITSYVVVSSSPLLETIHVHLLHRHVNGSMTNNRSHNSLTAD